MSNRIQATHFIKVYRFSGELYCSAIPLPIGSLSQSITMGAYPFALFLIRLKTPQEKENSIYYPTMLPTSMSETSK